MRRIQHLIAPALALGLQWPMVSHANDLLGCWRAEKITQFLADGRSGQSASNGSIEYLPNEIVSRYTNAQSQRFEIRYSYAIVRPGVYIATMTAHGTRPDLVGSRREYEYKVEGELLHITTYPQTTQPAPAVAAVRIESTSRRIPCDKPGPSSGVKTPAP